MDLLARVSHVWKEWVKTGHRRGSNVNNVSTTVSVKPHEWEEVGEWMWNHRNEFTALSVLPHDEKEHSYTQAPFEEITEEEYEGRVKVLHEIDLSKIVEIEDDTRLKENLACSGNSCEVT